MIVLPPEAALQLDPRDLVEALDQAHRALARGAAVQPAPTSLHVGLLGADDAAVVPMTALDSTRGLVAVKMLADVPGHRGQGLPAQRSTIVLLDATTAECVAVVDGRHVTRVRTAAVTVLATRTLARPDATTLGVVGAGALAVEHVRAHAAVLGLEYVVVWSRTTDRVRELEKAVSDVVRVRVAESVAEVFDTADVVCTLTPSTEPLVTRNLLRPGQHVNAVGSPPRPQFRELDVEVLAGADRVVVDSLAVATAESGNVVSALAAGVVQEAALVELGAVLEGAPGRTSDDDITVYNSVGIGLQDLATVALLVDRATADGTAHHVTLR